MAYVYLVYLKMIASSHTNHIISPKYALVATFLNVDTLKNIQIQIKKEDAIKHVS